MIRDASGKVFCSSERFRNVRIVVPFCVVITADKRADDAVNNAISPSPSGPRIRAVRAICSVPNNAFIGMSMVVQNVFLVRLLALKRFITDDSSGIEIFKRRSFSIHQDENTLRTYGVSKDEQIVAVVSQGAAVGTNQHRRTE
jgi:hypothetical protein